MAETLYATFSDPDRARTAAEELLARGISADEISLLVKERSHVKESQGGVDLEDTRPTTVLRGTEFSTALDPLSNDLRQFSVPRIEQGLDVELNPAQDDYPRTGSMSPTELSSTPPSAQRDYNRGLEDDSSNKDYQANVSDDMARDRASEVTRQEELEATPYSDKPKSETLRFSRGYNAIDENSPSGIKVDPDADAYRDADIHVRPDASTGEVAKGVAKGAGIGLGVGAVAAAATLLIPGIGFIIGGGALAAAVAALAAGAGTGAIAGGMAGFLHEHGLPDGTARKYAEVYDGGGAILAVTLARPELRQTVEDVLSASGAQMVETHQAYLS